MNEPRSIGIWPSLAARPLLQTLRKQEGIELLYDHPAQTSMRLRDHDVCLAFLAPIEYARESSGLLVVPDIALSSTGAADAATLHFRNGIHEVHTVAVDPSFPSEIVLARIILAEEFDLEPQFVPVSGDLNAMLARADAALLAGDAALGASAFHTDALDLVESWVQMTDLPYVHGFWCARESELTPDLVNALMESRRHGEAELDAIAEDVAETRAFPGFTADHLTDYLERFSYDFSEEAIEGLKEFHHFAYYHGVMPDIPEIELYVPDRPSEG